jgi:hypothetical protein
MPGFMVSTGLTGIGASAQNLRRPKNRDARGGGAAVHASSPKTKMPVSAAGVDGLVRWLKRALLTILLDARGAQAGKAVLID